MRFHHCSYDIIRPDEANGRFLFDDSDGRSLTILPTDDISNDFRNNFDGGKLDFVYHLTQGCTWLYDIKWKGRTITRY